MQLDPWMFQSMLCFKDHILPHLKNFVFFFFFFIMSVDVYWILGCVNLWHVLKTCVFFILLNYHAKGYLLDSWLFQFCYAPRTSSSSSSSLSCQLMQIGFVDILTFAMLEDFFFLLIIRIWCILVSKHQNVDSFQTIWQGLNLCLVVWGFCVNWWNMNSSIGLILLFWWGIFLVCYPFHDVLNSNFSLLIDLLFSSSLLCSSMKELCIVNIHYRCRTVNNWSKLKNPLNICNFQAHLSL